MIPRHDSRMNPDRHFQTPSELDDALEPILGELAVFRPSAVYLFGSAATARVHPGSDIDLAFLPDSPCDPVEVFETANRLAAMPGRDVDLVDLNRASTVMRKEVVVAGVLVHEFNPPRRMQFEMLALSDYARLNEERAPVLRALNGLTS
jgi:predicted nucleotidyltransferase